jgi:hypothetical protein
MHSAEQMGKGGKFDDVSLFRNNILRYLMYSTGGRPTILKKLIEGGIHICLYLNFWPIWWRSISWWEIFIGTWSWVINLF